MKCTALIVLFATAVCACQSSPGLAQEVVASGPSEAKSNAKGIDPSGTWRWEYDWQGEEMNDALRLSLDKEGRVVGTYHGRSEPVEIEKGRIQGDLVTLSVPIVLDGADVLLDFSARIKGDDLDGTVVAQVNGGSHEFPWKPQRSVEMEDVVGTWEIRVEGPNGQVFEPVMTISKEGDKYAGVYTAMQNRQLDVKDLRVEKNHLLFTVKGDFDGTSLQVDYKGRPYGDKIEGMLDYDLGGNVGEADFVAKRKQEKKKTADKE